MSNHYATVYKKETGEIVQVGGFSSEPDFVEMNFAIKVDVYGGADHDVVDAPADPETHYVAVIDGVPTVVDKPELLVFVENDKTTIQADGVDETTLTGLPDPCEIIIDDPDPLVETQVIQVTGGGFIFTAEDPGVYSIEVVRFPFLPWIVEITAA